MGVITEDHQINLGATRWTWLVLQMVKNLTIEKSFPTSNGYYTVQ